MLKKRDFHDLLGDLGDLVKSNFNQKVLASMEIFKVLSKTQQAVSNRKGFDLTDFDST